MPTEASRIANTVPPEPWRSFLKDLDSQLKDVVVLRCLGGFVVTQQYGIGRGTSDIDFLSVSAISAEDNLESLGGIGSALHKKHRVYVQYVGIATPPYDYADRLQVMFPEAAWSKLRLFALDPQDLALSRLSWSEIPTEIAKTFFAWHPRVISIRGFSERAISKRCGRIF